MISDTVWYLWLQQAVCTDYLHGPHNKIPQHRWLSQPAIYFLTVLVDGSPRLRHQHSQFLVIALFLTYRWPSSWCVCTWHETAREQGLWYLFLWRYCNTIMRTLPSWPHLNLLISQNPHLQILSHWDSVYIYGGRGDATYEVLKETIQSIAQVTPSLGLISHF